MHHSPDGLAAAITEESAAIAVLGEELIGGDRPIVTISGTPWVAGRASTENDPLPLHGPVAGRARSVNALLDLASRGVRATAVRMPRTVHNQGKGGFAGLLTDQAYQPGVAGYPGDGSQRWPAVDALDAAVLFRLALESAPAGTSWHAVADEGDKVADIAADLAVLLSAADWLQRLQGRAQHAHGSAQRRASRQRDRRELRQPRLVKTDLTGGAGNLTPAEAAAAPVRYALLDQNAVSGQFVNAESELPW
jgi:nucleoside-diphosphate-sugar epimerase